MSDTDTPTFTTRVLSTLVIPAQTAQIPPAVDYVRAVAATQGLDAHDCLHLEGAVEEACTNVVQHAFAAGEDGTIRLEVERRPGAISVRIHDQGLPADLTRLSQGQGLGLGSRMMQAFADEVRFHNLGAQGKCIELVKRLPYAGSDAVVQEATPPPPVETADLPEVTLRFMRPDESFKLARCIYFAYGYSYFSEYVYYPEKTREMLESGHLVSCVAVTPDDELIGHCALVFDDLADRTAESAVAVVLPSYRGKSLFERMKRFLMDAARDGLPTSGTAPRTLYGLFSEGATIHPFTQLVNQRVGAKETGVLLAYAPSTMQFKAIEGGARAVRQSVVMFYVRTTPEPHRAIYAPARHRDMIARIYGELGFDRLLLDAPESSVELSEIETRVRAEWGHGYIAVNRCGRDLAAQVKHLVHSLRAQKAECVLLDLPLSDPGTPAACEALEPLGFFFGGLLLEKRADGDLLRLQLLSDAMPDLEQMHVVSDFARTLRDYVVSCIPA